MEAIGSIYENVENRKSLSVDACCTILKNSRQLILQGPPGTGKTRMAKLIAAKMIGGKEYLESISSRREVNEETLIQLAEDILDEKNHDFQGQVRLVQFHPSYSYEDFIWGIDVNVKNGIVKYEGRSGILKAFAEEIVKNNLNAEKKNYVLIIDEINRAPLSEVLGELLYALEKRNEMITLRENTLMIPDNLYIIGTLNTADYSIGSLDYAMRRRFAFVNMESSPVGGSWLSMYEAVSELLSLKCVVKGVDYRNISLGGSYFILPDENDDAKEYKLRYQIVPILMEYYKDGFFRKEAKVDEEDNKAIKDIFASNEALYTYLKEKDWQRSAGN